MDIRTVPYSNTKPSETPDKNSVPFAIPDSMIAETVTEVEHYTDDLFRFKLTRSDEFRFRSGEFVMIGLPNSDKPIQRAYSIASPVWEDELEFYSIKVPDGLLTQHLQNIKVGDTVILRRKTTGTLVNGALLPGKRLFMFSTGTGIAPFASLIRDPETYDQFEQIILTHTCRTTPELKFGVDLIKQIETDPLMNEFTNGKLLHYTSVTQQEFSRKGRITDLIKSGQVFDHLGIVPLNPETDRAMICGSIAMLKDTKAILENTGLVEGTSSRPQSLVIERAFVG